MLSVSELKQRSFRSKILNFKDNYGPTDTINMLGGQL